MYRRFKMNFPIYTLTIENTGGLGVVSMTDILDGFVYKSYHDITGSLSPKFMLYLFKKQ
ncbi:hypothetical protein HNP82_002374 [Catenibacillus scindens]|uniref:Uncharacterized protein n=1 Tax=Catenibacillus scindens TaxID=673271 RepID=A0A7W8HB41_9FIRM|nr:hypothetical protein [Catenibacillus scindens]